MMSVIDGVTAPCLIRRGLSVAATMSKSGNPAYAYTSRASDNHNTTSAGRLTLIGSTSSCHAADCAHEDRQIEPEGAVPDVRHVESQPIVEIDLGASGD